MVSGEIVESVSYGDGLGMSQKVHTRVKVSEPVQVCGVSEALLEVREYVVAGYATRELQIFVINSVGQVLSPRPLVSLSELDGSHTTVAQALALVGVALV